MIRSAQLDAAAARLGGLAARLGGLHGRIAGANGRASGAVAALPAAWGGPSTESLNAAAGAYLDGVDGAPIADVVPVIERWSTLAREQASVLRTLESRRTATTAELGRASAAMVGAGAADPAAAAAAEGARQGLTADLAATDRQIERLHADWTRVCSANAGVVDSYRHALQTQSSESALAGFLDAGGSFAALDRSTLGGWIATLTAAQLGVVFADPAVAGAWWDSLSDELKIAFVAAHPDGVTGHLDAEIEAWKDGLDSDGLRALYTAVALAEAGIDPDQWIPAAGFAANEATVHSVYDYYSSLYLDHPDAFW